MSDPNIKKYLAYRHEAARMLDRLLDKQQTELIEKITQLLEAVGEEIDRQENQITEQDKLLDKCEEYLTAMEHNNDPWVRCLLTKLRDRKKGG